MLYAILCYHDEDFVGSWTKEQDAAVMEKLAVVQAKLTKQGRLGPVARLLPTTSATTLRKDDPPKSNCSASTSSIARTSTRRSTSRAISARPTPVVPMRSVPSAPFSPEAPCDRYCLDRYCADVGASPGGRRPAALFPQS
jgi:hypothetical protein